jgi:ABC-type nitrate/sulfonate/bicarbonate transport system ATPase subunit
MSFVSVEHLQKSYSGTPVFSDINCSIAQGEFVTLLGPSGCGKSTLLRCIAGLTPVDDGKILLDGQDIVPLSPQKRGIGMVFQSYALFPNMTVEQNVAFGLRMQKVNANDSQKRTTEALQLVELNDYAKRYPHQLSGVAMPARGTGALAGHPPTPVAAGRAAVCPGCAHSQTLARADPADPARTEPDDHFRDPRSGRSADDE